MVLSRLHGLDRKSWNRITPFAMLMLMSMLMPVLTIQL